ncbi:MAG: hypothetical protein JW925_02990 [Syntrophaceae bacterium]|nr:hypothetical protein [Syntrophaceae bacterium]
MTKKSDEIKTVHADTVLLDIVSNWPSTEAVFKKYDEKVGACLCCTCLFDTIEDVASRFSLDLKTFLHDIEKVALGKNLPK